MCDEVAEKPKMTNVKSIVPKPERGKTDGALRGVPARGVGAYAIGIAPKGAHAPCISNHEITCPYDGWNCESCCENCSKSCDWTCYSGAQSEPPIDAVFWHKTDMSCSDYIDIAICYIRCNHDGAKSNGFCHDRIRV